MLHGRRRRTQTISPNARTRLRSERERHPLRKQSGGCQSCCVSATGRVLKRLFVNAALFTLWRDEVHERWLKRHRDFVKGFSARPEIRLCLSRTIQLRKQQIVFRLRAVTLDRQRCLFRGSQPFLVRANCFDSKKLFPGFRDHVFERSNVRQGNDADAGSSQPLDDSPQSTKLDERSSRDNSEESQRAGKHSEILVAGTRWHRPRDLGRRAAAGDTHIRWSGEPLSDAIRRLLRRPTAVSSRRARSSPGSGGSHSRPGDRRPRRPSPSRSLRRGSSGSSPASGT